MSDIDDFIKSLGNKADSLSKYRTLNTNNMENITTIKPDILFPNSMSEQLNFLNSIKKHKK